MKVEVWTTRTSGRRHSWLEVNEAKISSCRKNIDLQIELFIMLPRNRDEAILLFRHSRNRGFHFVRASTLCLLQFLLILMNEERREPAMKMPRDCQEGSSPRYHVIFAAHDNQTRLWNRCHVLRGDLTKVERDRELSVHDPSRPDPRWLLLSPSALLYSQYSSQYGLCIIWLCPTPRSHGALEVTQG